jgi:hypothetical protein
MNFGMAIQITLFAADRLARHQQTIRAIGGEDHDEPFLSTTLRFFPAGVCGAANIILAAAIVC